MQDYGATMSTSEKIMYSTVKIEAGNSIGTGFFFLLKVDDKQYSILITNKHVVNYNENETVSFYLHLIDNDGNEDNCYKITWDTQWHFHPDKDLCFTFAGPLMNTIKEKTGKTVKYAQFTDDLIISNESLKKLSAVEEVVMVGYPNGLWDNVHNYPLFRHGYTSSHPGYDFNNRGLGVVDIAAFPGSSGSPVFIFNQGTYVSGKSVNVGDRLIFLGVLSSGALMGVNGEITEVEAPTSAGYIVTSKMMMNLGYYIRAENILDFKKTIKDVIS